MPSLKSVTRLVSSPLPRLALLVGVDLEDVFLLPVTPLNVSAVTQSLSSSCSRPLGTEDSFLGPIRFLGLALAAVFGRMYFASAGSRTSYDDRCFRTLSA